MAMAVVVSRPAQTRGGTEHMVPDCDVLSVRQAIVESPKACARCGAALSFGYAACGSCGLILEKRALQMRQPV